MYLIDANIFLEVELGQKKGEPARKLLKRFENGELTGYITDFHIDAIVIVMENYNKTGKDIAIFLSSLLKYSGLSIIDISLSSKINSTEIMEMYDLDFDDALICQCMKEKNLKKLISYDAHFDKIGFIDRLTPDKLI
jgi:predicted nucleic acid-binding protein